MSDPTYYYNNPSFVINDSSSQNQLYTVITEEDRRRSCIESFSKEQKQEQQQESSPVVTEEEVRTIDDNVVPLTDYPWVSTSSTQIRTLNVKAEGATLIFTKSSISSNKPILISIIDDTVYIWPTEFSDHRLMRTDGSSVTHGVNMLDFEGKSVVTKSPFVQFEWSLSLTSLELINFKGSNNTVRFDQSVLQPHMEFIIVGDDINNIVFSQYTFESVMLLVANADIDFGNSVCNKSLELELVGMGNVKNVTVMRSLTCDIAGTICATVRIDQETTVAETVVGTGTLTVLKD